MRVGVRQRLTPIGSQLFRARSRGASLAPFVNVTPGMSRSRHRSTLVTLPGPVAQWLSAMSMRVGAPVPRVLAVLLDGYVGRLPDELRRRLEEQMRRRSERRRPH